MASMLLKTSLSKTLICLSHKFHIGAGPLFVADAHVGLMGGLPSIDAGLHEVHATRVFFCVWDFLPIWPRAVLMALVARCASGCSRVHWTASPREQGMAVGLHPING